MKNIINKVIPYILFPASLFLLAGCSRDLPTQNIPERLSYYKYSNGTPSKKLVIKKGDALYELVVSILRDNSNDWGEDFVSYAPKYYFRSDSFMIDCFNTKIVVNYKMESGRWIQLSKPIVGCEDSIKVLESSR